MLGVDEHGLDEVDRNLMLALLDKYAGGPVGLGTLAAALSEEEDAIEEMYEPYLMQIGMLDRTPARTRRHSPRLPIFRPRTPQAPASLVLTFGIHPDTSRINYLFSCIYCPICYSTRMIPFHVHFRPGATIYEQVVYAAKKAMMAGQLRPGDAFPPCVLSAGN